jgi:hypothetical protein
VKLVDDLRCNKTVAKTFVPPRGSDLEIAFGVLFAALASGCGSNRPEIPPELLVQPATDGGGNASYPAGPYGVEVGSTAQNFSFQGWRDPKAAGFDPASFETISFADYYDPDGTKNVKLLLVNTAALWCQACKVEHDTLPARNAERVTSGLVILSTLFQDQSSQPADVSDLVAWTTNFEVDFPMALDPEYQMGVYASAATAPLNLIIDASNMKILRSFLGGEEQTIWPYIDGELAKP